MLQPVIMNVSSKGAVVIPAKTRKILGIKPKGKVMVFTKVKEKKVEFVPIEKDPIDYLSGHLKDKTKHFSTKTLLEERRKDLVLEERKYARLGI